MKGHQCDTNKGIIRYLRSFLSSWHRLFHAFPSVFPSWLSTLQPSSSGSLCSGFFWDAEIKKNHKSAMEKYVE